MLTHENTTAKTIESRLRNFKEISVSLFAAAIVVFGFLTFAWRVSAKRVALNTKDLREHNLLVISPTDPAFEAEVTRITSRKSDKLKEQIDALKPFSVLVKNGW